MKKILIIIFLLYSYDLFGQSLEYIGNNPFGIQLVSMNSTDSLLRLTMQIDFVDLDGDNDFDILYTGPRIDTISLGPAQDGQPVFLETQENIGTATNPIFADRKKVFDTMEFPLGTSVMFIDAGDLNNDGLVDLACSAEIDSNDYQSYLLFYIQKPDHSFNKIRCTDFELDAFIRKSIFIPELTDLDQDGDLDLLVCGTIPDFDDEELEIPTIMYAKNTGSIDNPDFLGWFYYPYGLNPDTSALFIRTGDLDLDSDLDAFGIDLSSEITQFKFAENIAGEGNRPSFNGFKINNMGIILPGENEFFLVPELCDIDGDGDLDVFIPYLFDLFPSFQYYENTDCEAVQYNINETICEGESVFIGEEEFTDSGTYQVTTSLANGCIEHTVLTLEVLPASNTYLEAEICSGESYDFGGENLTIPGDYAQSFLSSTGCDSTVFLKLEVVNIDTTVHSNNYILSAIQEEGLTYQWFDCNSNQDITGATQNEFEVPYSGSFAVKIEDITSGCVAVSACHFVIASSVTPSHENSILVLPNPTTGKIRLVNTTGLPILQVKIFDRTGSCVDNISGEDIQHIHIDKQGNGLYYLKIYCNGGVYVQEIILMK